MSRYGSYVGAPHIVSKYSLNGTGRVFFPGAFKASLSSFQDSYKSNRKKMSVSLDILKKYKIKQIKLGRKLVSKISDNGDRATYLYENYISPTLFAKALNIMAHYAKELEPNIKEIQLRNLRRENLEAKGISLKEINWFFQSFTKFTLPNRISFLKKIGVIKMKEKEALPKPAPKKQTLQVDKNGQYSFPFGGPKIKKVKI